MSNADQKTRMGKAIVDFEARRDDKGHLKVYTLPAGDGGGKYEVAGINDKYHPNELARIRELISAGKFDEAEQYCTNFMITYTNVVERWGIKNTGVEFYCRDSAFNRGPKGAARILQRALGVNDDGDIGPETKGKLEAKQGNPLSLLQDLRRAREQYERDVAKRDESSKFWNGLTNRWNKALDTAKKFAGEPQAVEAPVSVPSVPPSLHPMNTGKTWLQTLIEAVGQIFHHDTPQPTPQQTQLQLEVVQAPLWYQIAQKDIGFHETGVNRGIEHFIEAAHTGSLGDPYCAIGANADLEKAGVRGTRSAMARSFETNENFVEIDEPALGAIVTMWRGSPDSGTGHVFFYDGENEKGVRGIGYNEDDGCRRSFHDRSRIVGMYWPKSVPLPKLGKIEVGSTDDIVAKSET